MTDKQALRERYSPQPVPKCRICGEEMSIQRITTGAHVTYACSGEGDDGYFKIGRTFADEHYAQSRVTIVDFSDPEVIMLLDELEVSKSKCRELASELSAVNEIHNEAVFITDDHYEQCPPEVQKIIRSLAVLQMPAYDAFLAEVRTDAFNDLCAEFVRHAKGARLDDGDSVTLKEATDALLHCADQLREGGKQ